MTQPSSVAARMLQRQLAACKSVADEAISHCQSPCTQTLGGAVVTAVIESGSGIRSKSMRYGCKEIQRTLPAQVRDGLQ